MKISFEEKTALEQGVKHIVKRIEEIETDQSNTSLLRAVIDIKHIMWEILELISAVVDEIETYSYDGY